MLHVGAPMCVLGSVCADLLCKFDFNNWNLSLIKFRGCWKCVPCTERKWWGVIYLEVVVRACRLFIYLLFLYIRLGVLLFIWGMPQKLLGKSFKRCLELSNKIFGDFKTSILCGFLYNLFSLCLNDSSECEIKSKVHKCLSLEFPTGFWGWGQSAISYVRNSCIYFLISNFNIKPNE